MLPTPHSHQVALLFMWWKDPVELPKSLGQTRTPELQALHSIQVGFQMTSAIPVEA